jgi:uncharacterized repeat protein (TIGR03806 family)
MRMIAVPPDLQARALLVCACVMVFTPSVRSAERTPWTTSHLAGTPDPSPPYKVEPAFPGLTFDRPILLDHVPGTDRLAVGEVGGKLLTFTNDPKATRADLAIDLAVVRPGTVAFYGLAFHPKFETNRFVYLCYVAKNDTPDGTRVSRFTATSVNPLKLDPASEEVVLTYLSGGHNGGCLAFGRDGCLYISTGDAAVPTPPDPLKTGQDLTDLLSSILRVDVDHRDPGKAYRIPPDNPFLKTPGARPEIWAYGLRNPWRMSFDRDRGDLWVGDVGWELWEMIHLVRAGANCGWSVVEGSQPVLADVKRGPTPIIPPVVVHPHSEAASITGGYVYRGSRLNALRGVYVYGDYQSGKVWGLRHDGNAVTWRGELADSGLRLVSFGEDRDGELYLVEHERTNQIYRLVPDPNAGAQPAFPRKLSETGLFASTRELTPAPGVLPYAINAELWSDGARADRLMAVPGTARATIDAEGRWILPDGSVLARTVSLDLTESDPKTRRRLETQILHRESGTWRPYTYIWDDAQADATLADAAGTSRTFSVRDHGETREHPYRFAARSECILCHNPWAGAGGMGFGRQSASPLALTTAQIDHANQRERFHTIALVDGAIPQTSPRLADPRDTRAPLDARARAYLQVNCAHCHQIGAGGSANLVLSARTPLSQTLAINTAPAQGRFGIDDGRIIAPGEPERSVLFYRISKTGSGRMPRIGSDRVDPIGSRLIGEWIAAMPRSGPSKSPNEASHALSILADLKSAEPARHNAIKRVLESTSDSILMLRQFDSSAISEPVRREIAQAARSARPEVRDLFERFLPESERAHRLGDTIDTAALLARPGDARRGRDLFRAEGGLTCRTCHKAEGVGGDVGPTFDAIGSKYPRAEILSQIVDPSRTIEPKYQSHILVTRAGQIHVGPVVEESPTHVVLRNATNQTIRIARADIEERGRQKESIMPQGLLRELTSEQAADLLAYLSSLKSR